MVFDVSRTADPNARRLKLVDAPDVVLTISEPEPVEEQAKSAMAAAKARTKKGAEAASLLEDAEKKERRRAAARASRRVVVHASVDASFAEYAPSRRAAGWISARTCPARTPRPWARARSTRDEPRRVPVRGVRVRLRRA